MSRWSIEPHGEKNPVDVKFCTLIPQEGKVASLGQKKGPTEFMGINPEKGWIAVKLAYECKDGTTEICRVNYTPKYNTWSFKHPASNPDVRDKWGRVDNPLNPTTKREDNGVKVAGPQQMVDYITKVTKNEELAQRVVFLILDFFANMQRKAA